MQKLEVQMKAVLSIILLVVISAAACTGGDNGLTTPSGGNQSGTVSVTPASATMRVGESLTLTASGGNGFYAWETDRMSVLDVVNLSDGTNRQIRITLERMPTNGNTGSVTVSSRSSYATTSLTFRP